MLSRLLGRAYWISCEETRQVSKKRTQRDDHRSAQNHSQWTLLAIHHTAAAAATATTTAVATATANQIYFHWTHKLVPVDCCAELCLPRLCCLLRVFVVGSMSTVFDIFEHEPHEQIVNEFFRAQIKHLHIERWEIIFPVAKIDKITRYLETRN